MEGFKKVLAYLGNFIFGGVPAVIDLWVTEKDVAERVDKLYSSRMLEEHEEEDD